MTDPLLTVYNALTTFIGSDVQAIYGMTLPPDAVFPCAVYGQIYGGDGTNISGGLGSTYRMRVQIDLYHQSFEGVLGLRSALVAGFHRYASEGILDTRIDLDLPYVVDEMDPTGPALFRHIIDLGIDVDRATV